MSRLHCLKLISAFCIQGALSSSVLFSNSTSNSSATSTASNSTTSDLSTSFALSFTASASSVVTTSSTSHGVGDFVASGLGIASSSATTSNRSTTSSTSSVTTNATLSHPTTMALGVNASSSIPSNATGVDACYTSWTSYWDNLSPTYSQSTIGYSTYTVSETAELPWTSTETITTTIVSTIMQGAFAAATTTFVSEMTGVYAEPNTISGTTYVTSQVIETNIPISVPSNASITKPPCALPSSVSQCQNSWEEAVTELFGSMTASSHTPNWYVSWSATTPHCTQASVGSADCISLRDIYVTEYRTVLPSPRYEPVSAGYTNIANATATANDYVWPTWMTLAPQCTLGCARCAVTGGSIELLYWPATMTSPSGGPPIEVTTLDTTLTYPTVYVSYSKIYASDSCGPIGATVTNTIVAVPSDQISSVYGTITGGNGGMDVPYSTAVASFNVADLEPPIPYSVYASQPLCATWIAEQPWQWWNNGTPYGIGDNGKTTYVNVTCPRTMPYKPILYLPSDILNSMDPAWATCSGDIRGVYDPPRALTTAASVEGPTAPAAAATTPTQNASPESAVVAPTVAATNAATATSGPQPTSAPAEQTVPSAAQSDAVAQASGPSSADPSSNDPAVSQAASPTAAANQQSPSNAQDPTAQASAPDSAKSSADPAQSTGEDNSDPAAPATQAADPTARVADPLVSAIGQVAASSGAADGTQQAATSAADPTANATPAVATSNADPLVSAIGQVAASSGAGSTDQEASSAANIAPSAGPSSANDQTDPQGAAATVTGADGNKVSVIQSGGSVIVQGASSAVTLAPGQATTFAGQSISAVPSSGGGGFVVDGSKTVQAPSANATPNGGASAVLITDSAGQTASVIQFGGSVVVQGASSAVTLAPGQETTFNGQRISAAPSNSAGIVVDGSKTVQVASAGAHPTGQASALLITDSAGQVASVIQSDGSVVVQGASSTINLAAGQVTTFAGQTISAGSSGNAVIDGSRTVQLGSGGDNTASAAQVAITGAQGQNVQISSANGTLVAADGTSSITLEAGQTTTFDGRTISAPLSGSSVVIDGSITLGTAADNTASSPHAAITGAQGQSVQVFTANGHLIAADGTSSITLQGGQATTFDGRTISAPLTGSSVMIDGSSTLTLVADNIETSAQATITGAQGQSVRLSEVNGHLVAADGTSSITLQAGQVTTFDGKTLSAPLSGSFIVADGSTISLSDGTASAPTSTITGAQGQNIHISDQNGELLIADGSSTITLHAGQVTTFDGRTISAGSGASDAVVDGSSTISLATAVASATSGSSGGVHGQIPTTSAVVAATTTGTRQSAAGHLGFSAAFGSITLLFMCVMLL